jgi:hypothetical protein
MKTILLLAAYVLILCSQISPVRADVEPTEFEKALYAKARNEVLCKLNDDDFASYCVTMNIGGATLLKIHDDIMEKQTELTDLISQGLNDDHPQVMAVNAALKDLRAQYAVKIAEARKGVEVEAKIAEATLTALSQYQR